ncbi:beta-N-acetylhexosaminidase [Sphingosinicella terrae]|uniref:beta-N-acetylhexosaminidase n=1 Tax=Sphingosinicella terrae TaxID=2172047 RepID=UPI000E0DD821|nr:family 20 glycosylhydrolase [Sphingosinicella terrae]
MIRALLAPILLMLATSPAAAATPPHALPLLPQPRSAVPLDGRFAVTADTIIVAEGEGARAAAERFAALLARTAGIRLRLADRPVSGAIVFRRAPGFSAEAYRLEVAPGGATVTASDLSGLLYGGVSLWQLLTPGESDGRLTAPAVRIDDAPRFAWRGLMLDSARHFQSPEFVMRLIDWMAVHKLNRLHWHLTDDQGWRLEIRRYPRLTEIGAWRVPAGALGAPPLPRIGGFYTQDQVRAIVAHARARGIEIVPEIEMPGHALSAIRAYPELGTGMPLDPGAESDWGVFPWLYNVEEPTFAFLENVLDEVLELFPGTFIHVGGDEAVKDQWRASPAVQARMRALGVADEAALQGWFVARIGRFLEARGRRLIGWDEILEGGVPQGAAIMSWRGIDGAVHAAQSGHDAVLSPAPILYFDNRQGGTSAEPPGRGRLVDLAEVYAFDPAPASLTPDQQRHILGLQGNLWTEHVRTEERAAHMLFPRAAAIAERGWSAAETREFAGFVDRLLPQLDRLDPLGLRPADSAFRVRADLRAEGGTVIATLSNQIASELRYTLDGSDPGAGSAIYSGPIRLQRSARLRAVALRGGRLLSGALDLAVDRLAALRRDDTQLKLCSENIALALEDDWPAQGDRAVFLTDVMNPCWIYEDAPLDGVSAIEIDVGQLPFNFQIGRDVERIRFREPATQAGEFEVRLGGCEGERMAVLPLAPAADHPGVTRLRAPLPPRTGRSDLCITYTARGVEPLWAVDMIQLVPAE